MEDLTKGFSKAGKTLVEKQVQDPKTGRVFTRKYWVADSDSDGTLKLSPDKVKEIEDLFQTNKPEALKKLKESGVSWTENQHPAINLMRAKMALKQASGASTTLATGSKPKAITQPDVKPAPANSTNLQADFDALYKTDKAKAFELLKANGITWNENAHPAINAMRAKMALTQYNSNLGKNPAPTSSDKLTTSDNALNPEAEGEKPEEKVEKEPEPESPKVPTQEEKTAIARSGFTSRADFNRKANELIKGLQDKDVRDMAKLKMVGADPESVEYLTKFLLPRYTEVAGDVESSIANADAMFGTNLPKKVIEYLSSFEKLSKLSNEGLLKKVGSRLSTIYRLDTYNTNYVHQATEMKDRHIMSHAWHSRNFRQVTDPKEFRDMWDSRLDYLVESLSDDPRIHKSAVHYAEEMRGLLDSINNNPVIFKELPRVDVNLSESITREMTGVLTFESKYLTPGGEYWEKVMASGNDHRIACLKAMKERWDKGETIRLGEDQRTSFSGRFEWADDVVYSGFPGGRVNLSKRDVEIVKEAKAFLSAGGRPLGEARYAMERLSRGMPLDVMLPMLSIIEFEKTISDCGWAFGKTNDIELFKAIKPLTRKGLGFGENNEKVRKMLHAELIMDVGSSAIKLKPSISSKDAKLAEALDKAYEQFENYKAYVNDDKALAVEFTANSMIAKASNEEFLEVSNQIAGDFDSKHAVKSYKILGVYKVTEMPEVDGRFESTAKEKGNVRSLYHGTGSFATAAVMGQSGQFKVVQAKVGRMLGDGIYLADKTSKSMLYVSDSGYSKKGVEGTMMVCDAILGKTSGSRSAFLQGGHNGAHSVDTIEAVTTHKDWKHLQNNEWCVKDPKNVRPRYLVHIKV